MVPVTWRGRVQTTVSDPRATPFPNLLKRDFKVALPNLTWVSDFTYIPTDEGWLYLCSFVDLFSRRVVGWEISVPSISIWPLPRFTMPWRTDIRGTIW